MFIFFLHSSFSSFFFLSLSLCPFSFTPCFCLLALIIIMVTAKGYFLTISTVGNNGHFILGGEGYGQPWWSTPSPLSLTEGSSFRLVLAFGTARQEGFLLMCLSFTKDVMLLFLGSCWEPSVQRGGTVHGSSSRALSH